MNILLSSVGRRPYLVRWFQEALVQNNLEGWVIAADVDVLSPARAFTDHFVEAPPVTTPQYQSWLAEILKKYEIGLAVSINDFELSEWAHLGQNKEWDALIRLTPEIQACVEDKFVMGKVLKDFGLPTPQTWLGGSDASEITGEREYVTKGRFGSASRGLRFSDQARLQETISSAAQEVTTRHGQPANEQDEFHPSDLVIVQERIFGTEYGLDIVCDLNGEFAGVLARRKISMRAGETDRAESVPSAVFEEIARAIVEAVPHPKTCDSITEGQMFPSWTNFR